MYCLNAVNRHPPYKMHDHQSAGIGFDKLRFSHICDILPLLKVFLYFYENIWVFNPWDKKKLMIEDEAAWNDHLCQWQDLFHSM